MEKQAQISVDDLLKDIAQLDTSSLESSSAEVLALYVAGQQPLGDKAE